MAEVQFLGVVEHSNLVKLIGYCAVDGERGIQRLLVYEYMPNKSLEHHLFNRAYDPLPWRTRLEILLGAAQGLAYLHEELEVQVSFKAIHHILFTFVCPLEEKEKQEKRQYITSSMFRWKICVNILVD